MFIAVDRIEILFYWNEHTQLIEREKWNCEKCMHWLWKQFSVKSTEDDHKATCWLKCYDKEDKKK